MHIRHTYARATCTFILQNIQKHTEGKINIFTPFCTFLFTVDPDISLKLTVL